jgi:hypothetical protein
MTKRLFEEETFCKDTDDMLQKAVVKYGKLLFTKDGWTMDKQSKIEIMNAVENLATRWMYRASLFAMYRTQTKTLEQLKKQKVQLELDDLDMAWKTLE